MHVGHDLGDLPGIVVVGREDAAAVPEAPAAAAEHDAVARRALPVVHRGASIGEGAAGRPTEAVQCVRHRRRLQATDGRGRELEVIEFDARSRPVLIGDTPIVETYINSYFANGAPIVPTGGTGADDLAALDALREIAPGREVVGVPCPVIGYGGGGVHCITQQVPRV